MRPLSHKHLDEAREALVSFIREWRLDLLVGVSSEELSDIFIDSLITVGVDVAPPTSQRGENDASQMD